MESSAPEDLEDNVSTSKIADSIRNNIARLINVQPAEINDSVPFASLGMDSKRVVALCMELESLLERKIPPALMFEYPTVGELAAFLASDPAAALGAPVGTVAANGGGGDGKVAIVGIACRLPGASTPAELWSLLRAGRDAVGEPPAERAGLGGAAATAQGGYVERAFEFDYGFFEISPTEASRMDPQQRLLLQATWDALEDAGISPASIRGSRTGVFVGISHSNYADVLAPTGEPGDAFLGTGTALSIAANRISYLFDLRGPSFAVDTACSSSMTALHLARVALLQGECDLAIVAGANLILTGEVTQAFQTAGMLSPGSRCKSFSNTADGYVRSEGVVVLVLRRTAAGARDDAYALVRSTEINQDGRSNGLVAPNPKAQQALLGGAYARAGLAPDDVAFIEAHGSGTELGDAIELESLATALGRRRGRPLLVGSLKSNIGHAEAAAGLAGVLKSTLALHHRLLPPSIHYSGGNGQVDWAKLGIEVPTAPVELGAGTIIAGVSSFGFGGTNVHAILESAPSEVEAASTEVGAAAATGSTAAAATGTTESDDRPVILLSGKTERAAAQRAQELAAFLRANPDVPLAELGRELAQGRQHFPWRVAITGASASEVERALAAARPRHTRPAEVGVAFGDPRRASADAAPDADELAERLPAAARGASLGGPEERYTRILLGQLLAARALARSPIAWKAISGSGVGLVAAAVASGHLAWETALRLARAWGRVLGSAEGPPREAAIDLLFDVTRGIAIAESATELRDERDQVIAREAMVSDFWFKLDQRGEPAGGPSGLELVRRTEQGAWERVDGNDAAEVICIAYGVGAQTRPGAAAPRRIRDLPGYPWERTAILPPAASAAASASRRDQHPLLGAQIELGGWEDGSLFRQEHFEPRELLDHVVSGLPVLPGASMLEAMSSAAAAAGASALGTVEFQAMLPLTGASELQTSVVRRGDGHEVKLSARGDRSWTVLASARADQAVPAAGGELARARGLRSSIDVVSGDTLYRELADLGLTYGPAFQRVTAVYRGNNEALASLAETAAPRGCAISAAVLDAALHPIVTLMTTAQRRERTGTLVPRRVEGFAIVSSKPARWSYVSVRKDGATPPVDVTLLDEAFEPVAFVRGLSFASRAEHARSVAGATAGRSAGRGSEMMHFYETAWREPAPSAPGRGLEVAGRWLLLEPPGVTFAAGTAAAPREVEVRSASYAPADPQAFERTLREALMAAPHQGVILVTPTAPEADAPGAATQLTRLIVWAVQIISRLPLPATPRLVLVTTDATKVGDGDRVAGIASAPLWGLTRSIGFELPELRCIAIDVERESDARATGALIWDAIRDGNVEPLRAVRRGKLLAQRFRPSPGPDRSSWAPRPDGRYLVTGAFGGLGSLIVQWLVDRGARNLVLLGRSAPNEVVQRVLAEWQRQGINVTAAQVDVGDRAALEAVLRAPSAAPLRGVFHAAGVLDDQAMLDMPLSSIDDVFRPKVAGAWNLHELTRDAELEAFVLFSSAAAVLGSPGQSNYVAANSFMDALAHHRRARRLPASSINWGPWAEVGMAADLLEQEKDQELGHLVKLIKADQGLQILEDIIAASWCQITPLPFDITNLMQFNPGALSNHYFQDVVRSELQALGSATGSVQLQRPELDEEFVAPRNEIERTIASIWQRALGIDRVGVRDDFFSLGGDSVLAAQIASHVTKTFAVPLDLKAAFEALTVERVAQLVETKLLERLEGMSDEEAARLLESTAE